jgi:hypothetical protein
MGELIVVMMKEPHDEANNKENTKAKIEAIAYSIARIAPYENHVYLYA